MANNVMHSSHTKLARPTLTRNQPPDGDSSRNPASPLNWSSQAFRTASATIIFRIKGLNRFHAGFLPARSDRVADPRPAARLSRLRRRPRRRAPLRLQNLAGRPARGRRRGSARLRHRQGGQLPALSRDGSSVEQRESNKDFANPSHASIGSAALIFGFLGIQLHGQKALQIYRWRDAYF